MESKKTFLQLEAEIVRVLKTIYDPEIPVNVYDLGLIYAIDTDEENNVEIKMTLTAPNCPIADSIISEIELKVNQINDVNRATINLVFDPPWNQSLMSEEAKLELGFL